MIINIIISLISIIVIVIFNIFNYGLKPKIKDNIDDVPISIKSKYKGSHESLYNTIDDAFYHYDIDRMNNMIGGIEKNKKDKKIKNKVNNTTIHNWYKYNSWEDLKNNTNDWYAYIKDRNNGRINFLFDWTKVLKEIDPYLHKTNETIGIIRAESDRKTLYIYAMEESKELNNSLSYSAGISTVVVKKYASIPGYFMFHTHPMKSDPLPSDADILTSLITCYDKEFIGQVVIGKYGIITYYITFERISQLLNNNNKIISELTYFTYCYDLINAWNSFTHSTGPITPQDRINFLKKWGFYLIINPSFAYISDNHDKTWLSSPLSDRFIYTKYELADKIKEVVKKLELNEKKMMEKNKITDYVLNKKNE